MVIAAGFDVHGNLAFMVCDPMKLAKSPNSKSSSTSTPVGKNGNTQIQLLNINFPPRINIKAAGSPQHARKTLFNSDDNCTNKAREENSSDIGQLSAVPDAEVASTGSVNGAQSEVESSCCLIEVLEAQHEYSSDGETTMYSAETAESRNYPSPKGGIFQQVGRSQSCINYNRWGPVSKNSAARRAVQVQKRNNMQGRKVYSQGATSQRINDYYSPTVSSIMKKRNNLEPQIRPPRLSAGNSSPRWMF